MRTRSQSRNSNRQQQQVNPTFVEPFNLVEPIENQAPPVVTMDDNRTMAQLLEAPTEGYEDAIVVPEITADNFELKHGLLTLCFAFPNSLEGAARIWLEKEPPRSILTWDDLVSKFINKFFPPSKTTNLRNEITRFQQRFDETFYEAWDRFNDLLRACLHHGFLELHQLDTFYNALNSNDQDSLNSAAGGNFLDKMPRDCLRIIESKSKVRNSRNKPVVAKVSSSTSTPGISPDVAKLKDMVKALLLDKKSQAPAPFESGRGKLCYLRSFLKTGRALIDVYEGELTLRVGKEAVTFNLDQTSRYSTNTLYTANRIDVIEMACEEYSKEVLGFFDVIASGNPSPYYGRIISTSSPTCTPFGDSDSLLEEVDAFLALEDDPTSPEVDDSYYDPEGDILLLESFLNDDPSLPPPTHGNYLPEI
ncbi:reverse transcriptase domain-containing protein [Tanacetum coccineum]